MKVIRKSKKYMGCRFKVYSRYVTGIAEGKQEIAQKKYLKTKWLIQ